MKIKQFIVLMGIFSITSCLSVMAVDGYAPAGPGENNKKTLHSHKDEKNPGLFAPKKKSEEKKDQEFDNIPVSDSDDNILVSDSDDEDEWLNKTLSKYDEEAIKKHEEAIKNHEEAIKKNTKK